jgi:hypothetical protein
MWELLVRRVGKAVRDRRGRGAFVYLVLAAFALQGSVTQSHLHVGALAQQATVATFQSSPGLSLEATAKAPVKPLPSPRDDNNCPICHAASIAGAVFASAAPILRVPSLSSLVPYVDEHAVLVERFTAAWRSRAPPSL